VFELGDESVLVVRNADGVVNAFHNVCLHRGHILCEAARGHRATFVCPYHSWTWTLDGRLQHVPLAGEFPAGIPRQFRHLLNVHCRVWAGLVWVCLNEPRTTLEQFLGDSAAPIEACHLESMVLKADQTFPGRSNWKITAEEWATSTRERAGTSWLFPNVLLTSRGDEVELCRLRPAADDPDRALMDVFRLARPGPLASRAAHVDMPSPAAPTGAVSSASGGEEVYRFHQRIDACLGGSVAPDVRVG
jgi:nitrite reductase/ring-hydroxylating ferredoxin subunit